MFRNLFLDKSLKKRIFAGFVQNEENLPKVKNLKSYQKVLKYSYFSKNILIPKILIGERLFFHNGKEIISLKVSSNMVGYKLSEFLYTKKIVQKKKSKK